MQQKKRYEEQMQHSTAELPIALHQLEYPEGTDVLFYLHWHREFEFLVVTKGNIEITIDDRSYLLQEWDCVFINSDCYHSARACNGNSCCFFAIDFSYAFLHEDLYTHFSRQYIRPVLEKKIMFPERIQKQAVPSIAWQAQAIQFLCEINQCGEKKLADFELLVKGRIYCIWELYYQHAVYQNMDNDENLAKKDRLKPVIDYIKQNYSYEITLTELSDVLPMSEGQFCRIFKEAMKVSPFQYLIRYRILKSCGLLIETDKKIGEIANLCGFNNISYYNKVFMKMIGCTPKTYRDSYF